jgi:CRISPR/Cas system CSM-associated protein Csm3 (group 7 of RAMP superfamily)
VSSLHSVGIPLSIRFEQALHVGTGQGDGLVDRTVRRTAEGYPYVPASALKGALRQTAERLVRHLDAAAEFGGMEPDQHLGARRRGGDAVPHRCEAPRAEAMCKSKSPCILCRIFGNVYTGRRLIVDDATATPSPGMRSRQSLIEASADEDGSAVERTGSAGRATETVTRLQMDRRRLGAQSGALFTTEYARVRSTFEGGLSGAIPLTPMDHDDAGGEPAELVLLAAALRATDQIGGEASSGRGACRILVRSNGTGESEAPELGVGDDTYAIDRLLRPGALEALRWGRIEGDL